MAPVDQNTSDPKWFYLTLFLAAAFLTLQFLKYLSSKE